ncbi:alpha/beta hydrolase-fold protein [Glaciecola siphonariae]|uniref:Alpha/beta hydrolase-fold protein n=1 Tax=Glaciecola siphonariae TaxID=521012 RepID=A0ABV9LW73_9ALTE
MKPLKLQASNLLICISLVLACVNAHAKTISISANQAIDAPGRLHIIFTQDSEREPRLYSAWPVQNVEPLFSQDLDGLGQTLTLDTNTLGGFPFKTMQDLPAGMWRVQAIYDTNTLDSGINSPANAYSLPQAIEIKAGVAPTLNFELNQTVAADALPEDQALLKFIKIKSDILSEFWGSDMYLRAGVLLPATYYDKPLKKFPVFFDIGGYGARYTRAERWYQSEEFQEYWQADDTPQMVIVYLDGEAPFGDPYQINSANNGPYGDATWQELLGYLNQNFNIVDTAQGRFVSGCSTGGWVSLALQLFYPDTFNGAWSYSADGVDFRYFQLVDIYSDDNAFFNEHGQERPSYRGKDGEVIFSIKREIDMENQMGRGNSYVTSGGQWGGWNAVYSPKLDSGLPAPIWDPASGEINKDVAEAWKQYDLRLYTQKNWQTLGPKLAGKLHIWMGDMDNFYLNNAMYLFEDMLKSRTEPASDAVFEYKRGVGHCDFNRYDMRKKTIAQMYERFQKTR